jgi:acyl-coenzyme A thioesterase PaaI-like protein
MPTLELPHTAGCLVCGRENLHGLHLSLFVDPDTGIVTTRAIPTHFHIGFEGVVHGGWIATVVDEAMVWSAIWASRRSCLAGEFTVRFKRKLEVGQPVTVKAKVNSLRSRMIEVESEVCTAAGETAVIATGKYIPLSPEITAEFFLSLVPDPSTIAAVDHLRADKRPDTIGT